MPAPAWVLFGGTFVNRFGSFVLVFLVLYLREKGFSPAEAGTAVGAYGFGSLAAALAGGWVADRFGRRNAISLSMFSAAATMLALSQAERLPLIVALSALAGLTSELYRPASSALLTDLIPAGQRVTAFALYRLAINLGFAAGLRRPACWRSVPSSSSSSARPSRPPLSGSPRFSFSPRAFARHGRRSGPASFSAPCAPTGSSSSSWSPRSSRASSTSRAR
jgi:MFS family permease